MTAVAAQLARATAKHQSGALAEAEATYRQVLEQEPDQADALNLLGVVCGQTDRWDEALRLLRRTVEVRPEHPQSRYNLGNVLRQRGDLSNALVEYDAAVAAAPDYTAAHFNRGLTLWDLQKSEEATSALQRVIEIDPNHSQARAALAEILSATGETEKAAEQWRVLVEAEPGNVAHLLDLGIALHQIGRIDEAIEEFRRAVDLQPQAAATWCNLGAALRIAGQASEAIEVLEKAVELDPRLLAAHTNLAAACVSLKDLTRAMKACRAALDLAPRDASVHSTTAKTLLKAGELAMGEDHLRIAIRLEPGSVDLRTELGDLLRNQGRFDDADTEFTEALRLDPQSADAMAGRIGLLLERNDPDAALALAESSLRVQPYEVTVASAAASVYIECRRYDEAAALLQRQVDHQNTSPAQRHMLLFRLADVYDRTADYAVAWKTYEQANHAKEVSFNREAVSVQIESIRRVFSRSFLRSAPRADTGPLRPVFIAGMPRTGTTLVEQILDSHPDLTGTGEIGLMGRIVGRIEPLAGISGPFPQCAATLTGENLQRLAEFAFQELGKMALGTQAITEKTPANFLYLGLIEMLFPEARIIWCLRDPLDTCLSCYFHDFTGALPFAYDLENLGFYYRRHLELLEHWKQTLSIPLLTVQYEELVTDQETMTHRLLEFCDLPWNEACLNFHRNERVAQTASIQQVRKPIYRSSVNRHRNYEQYLQPLKDALAGN